MQRAGGLLLRAGPWYAKSVPGAQLGRFESGVSLQPLTPNAVLWEAALPASGRQAERIRAAAGRRALSTVSVLTSLRTVQVF